MEINEIIEKIVATCKGHMQNGDWKKNEAMRYAYIELGKHVSKSSRFFFSMEGKYGETGLSVEEMKQIHYANSGKEVTCYVSAKMLKDIFEKLGIESHILQSTTPRVYSSQGESIDIYHSYLLCHGDDDKKYFMSLNTDLVNIKYNFPLEHFANKIPYYYNGVQTYRGEEVDSSTLTPQELFEIDKKIGYAIPIIDFHDKKVKFVYANKDFTHDTFGKQLNQAEEYLNSQLRKLDNGFLNSFYAKVLSFKNPDGTSKEGFTELTAQEKRELEMFVFKKGFELINEKLQVKNQNPEEFLKFFEDEKMDLAQFKDGMKKYILGHLTEETEWVIHDEFENPFKTSTFVLNLIKHLEGVPDEETAKTLTPEQRTRQREFYVKSIQNLSKQFIPKEVLLKYRGDKNPSNLFLVDKLKNYFVRDFECESSKECSYLPEFCYKFGTVEQAAFLKQYLRAVFKPELPEEKDFLSRIMFTVVSENENCNNFAFLFHIKSKEEESKEPVYSLLYDPKTNSLEHTNFLELRSKYKILSKTVMNQLSGKKIDIEELQKIEEMERDEPSL